MEFSRGNTQEKMKTATTFLILVATADVSHNYKPIHEYWHYIIIHVTHKNKHDHRVTRTATGATYRRGARALAGGLKLRPRVV